MHLQARNSSNEERRAPVLPLHHVLASQRGRAMRFRDYHLFRFEIPECNLERPRAGKIR